MLSNYAPSNRIVYLSTSGSDSNRGNSEDQAWQTMGKVNAVTQARPGESITVLLKAGDTFSSGTGFVLPFHGTPSRYCYLGRYGAGANPIVNKTGGGASYGITVGKNYWVINGIDGTVGGRNISITDAHHIHVSNGDFIATTTDESSINMDCSSDNLTHDIWLESLTIHGTPGWGVTGGGNQVYNMTIKHCTFTNIGSGAGSVAHHSIYLSGVKNFLIENCVSTGSWNSGIKLVKGGKTCSGVIRRNTITDCARSTSSGLDISLDGIIDGLVIENNLLKDNLYDLGINWENNIAQNIKVYNNTIIRHYIGIGIGSGASQWDVKNNNVVQDMAWISNNLRSCLNFDGPANATDNIFQDNNWYFKNGAGFENPIRDNGGTFSFATWQGKAGSPDSTGSSVDPTFVTAYSDLHLQAGSSIRNSGTNIGENSRSDRDGLPLDTTPHVGCYQQ